MAYTADDFALLPWNPFVEKRGVTAKWSPLKQHKEFSYPLNKIDRNRVLNFICFAYHKRSILHEDYPDTRERTRTAAKLAGWKTNDDNKFPAEVETMLNCQNKMINRMIIRFCIIQHDFEYSAMVSVTLSLTSMMFEMQSSESDGTLADKQKDLASTFKDMKAILREIEETRDSIFGNKGLEEDINADILSHEVIPGWTERIANDEYKQRNEQRENA